MAVFKPGDYVRCTHTGAEGFLEKNDNSSTYTLCLPVVGHEESYNSYTTSGKYSTQDSHPCLEHISPPPSEVFEITKLTPDKQLIHFKELGIYVYDSPNGVIQLTKEQTL